MKSRKSVNPVDLSDILVDIDVKLLQIEQAKGAIHDIILEPALVKYCAKQLCLQRGKDPSSWEDLKAVLMESTGLTLETFNYAQQYSETPEFPYELCQWRYIKAQLNDPFIYKLHGDLCSKALSLKNSSPMKSTKPLAMTGAK